MLPPPCAANICFCNGTSPSSPLPCSLSPPPVRSKYGLEDPLEQFLWVYEEIRGMGNPTAWVGCCLHNIGCNQMSPRMSSGFRGVLIYYDKLESETSEMGWPAWLALMTSNWVAFLAGLHTSGCHQMVAPKKKQSVMCKQHHGSPVQ